VAEEYDFPDITVECNWLRCLMIKVPLQNVPLMQRNGFKNISLDNLWASKVVTLIVMKTSLLLL